MTLQYTDIFVPGGFPKHTYNPRPEFKIEEKLKEATQTLCKIVSVTGNTKSGKTVLVKKTLAQKNTIWVDGGSVGKEEDFWDIIIGQLDLFQGTETTTQEGKAAELSASGKAEANFIIAKGEAGITGKQQITRSLGTTNSRNTGSRIVALKGLASAKRPLIVDDFHYLKRETQGKLSEL
nr:hypothetical protein [uncultured Dethiosulfovibrio sp.]